MNIKHTNWVASFILTLFSIPIFSSCSSGDDFEIYSSIEGRVTDFTTGQALDNASVTLSPSSLTKQTDSDGRYIFSNIDARQYTLSVQKAGYQSNRKSVTALSGETIVVDIQLQTIPK